MEVAGLVLGVVGALPMIVQIVEGYRMIGESAGLTKHMAMLQENLETEVLVLEDIYEILLNGIVPAGQLERLRKLKPTDDNWQIYDRKIRMRLGKSYDGFYLNVKEIEGAVEDLREKLPRRPSKKVLDKNWSSKLSTLASEAKFRTSATLKKKDCDDALAKIRENNTSLMGLVSRRAAFETTRRANSRAKFAREVRTTAQGLFSAVRNVMRCQCVDSHRVGLHLRQRMDEGEDSQNGGVSFEMILSTTNGHHKHNPSFDMLKIEWKREQAVLSEQHSSKEISQSFGSLSLENRGASKQKLGFSSGSRFGEASRLPSSSKPKRPKQVRFFQGPSVDSSMEHSRGKSIAATITVPKITDLCGYIQRSGVMTKHPFGFIPCVEAPKGFDLYYHDFLRSFNTESLLLRDALKDGNPHRVNFELPERLNVALALSYGMLQLCNTQWLGRVISLDDILLLREANATRWFGRSLDHPSLFLVHQPSTGSSGAKPIKAANFAILSLGVVLTHLIIGCQVEAIDVSEDMTREILNQKGKLACEKVVNCGDATEKYGDAVQWCFRRGFAFETLEDEELSREFHDAVIARLESDLKNFHNVDIQD